MTPDDPDDEPVVEEPRFRDLDERTKTRLRDAGRTGIAEAFAELDAAVARSTDRTYRQHRKELKR